MIKQQIYIFFYFLLTFVTIACQESNNVSDTGWINGLKAYLEFPMEGGSEYCSFSLQNGLDASLLECYVPAKDAGWCEASVEGGKLIIRAFRSYTDSERHTSVTVEYERRYSFVIQVKQMAGFSENDIPIKVVSATADTENNNNEMDKSYDDDLNTYFCSKGGTDVTKTFRMTYTLESGHTLYRIIYTPRTKGNKWGSFNKFEVEVATGDAPTQFVKVASFERGDGVHTPLDFTLDTPVPDAKYVRFVVHSAYMKRVSCAEMDFFEPSKNRFDYRSIFADDLYTQLKEGVTDNLIKNMPDNEMRKLALALSEGNYESKYRVAEYRPYQHPSVMAAVNRTSRYSLSDNPTGIYAVAGEKLYIALDKLYRGADISLMVRDLNGGYGNSKTYQLKKGLNIIEPTIGGLIYILNHVEDNIPLLLENDSDKQRAMDKTVKVHIIMGKVNGYYDCHKNVPEEWPEILENAQYQDMDVLGQYAHVTWRVSDFQTYTSDVTMLLNNYDKLVWLEEEFIGLVKYGKLFNNRMHFSIDYDATSPNASNYRTVYPPRNAAKICDPLRFDVNLWGPSHEVGHMNQTRPGLKWIGTTEITNNILSLYVQTSFGQPGRLLDEKDGKTVYDYGLEKVVAKKIPHNSSQADVFERLVPFWQLKLYMIDVLKKENFYHDLYEYFRTYDYEALNADKYTQGVYQLDFVRQVCRISRLNMLDFFEKWGFLTPIDADINDYSKARFTITEGQITALKDEVNKQNYKMPHPEVHLINENNMYNYND